jgi:hypothetical protein
VPPALVGHDNNDAVLVTLDPHAHGSWLLGVGVCDHVDDGFVTGQCDLVGQFGGQAGASGRTLNGSADFGGGFLLSRSGPA